MRRIARHQTVPAVLSLATLAALLVQQAGAQAAGSAASVGKTAPTAPCQAGQLRASDLSTDRTPPILGTPSRVSFVLANGCAVPLPAAAWVLSVDKRPVDSGMTRELVGRSSLTVSAQWTATTGTHSISVTVRPSASRSRLAEEGTALASTSIVVTTFADWPHWLPSLELAARTAVLQSLSEAQLTNVIIAGPVASGGVLTAPPLPVMQLLAMQAGVPAPIASAFSGGLANQWSIWVAAVHVNNLVWYPTFASYPAPVAPPIPNLPTPLHALATNSGLSPRDISLAITQRVSPAVLSDPGAARAIDDFGRWFDRCYTLLATTTLVTNVLGGGPVPSYEPLKQPAGPVMGRGSMTPGGLRVGSCPVP